MLDILAPAIRILLLWSFTRFATMGYFTPEDAGEFAKVAMDLLMYGLPLIYAAWAARRESIMIKGRRK
jgi:hypothetical protein